MTSNQQLPRWLKLGLAFPIIFLNLWLLGLLFQSLQPITSILISASLIAFLLDYPILFLEEHGMKRGWAIGLVLLVALMLLGILVFILGPLLFQQLVEFGNRLPAWIEKGKQELQALNNQPALQQLPIDLNSITIQLSSQLSGILQSLTSELINATLGTINSALNVLLTLVLTIFLVLHGKSIWYGLLSWIPNTWNSLIQTSLKQSFQNYFAGQAIMASILSLVLITAFETLGIPFGLLFGIGIGSASLIPFGGTLSITLISVLVSFQDIWLGVKVLTVAIVLGQINENFVAPRLIGRITGLNPAWVILSLLVGAKIGGVLGLLTAVPVASFIKRTADILRQDTPEKPMAIAMVEANREPT